MAIVMMIEISLKLLVALTFAAADNAACCPRMYVKPSHQADQSNHKGDHQEGDGSYDCSYYGSDGSSPSSTVVIVVVVGVVIIVIVVIVVTIVIVVVIVAVIIVVSSIYHKAGD